MIKQKTTPLRFGIVTDMHYADVPDNIELNRYYRQALVKLREFTDVMNTENVNFVVELGDLKDQGNPPNETQTFGFLNTVENTLQRFKGPVYHVLGNHDHDSISKSQFLSAIHNEGFSKALSYYSFTIKGIHFIVLDANYKLNGEEYDHGNFDWTEALIPPEQVNWLKKDLASHPNPTIVFSHHQLDTPKVEDTRHCPKNADEIRKILEDSGRVSVVFQGHYHKGGINIINDICYYTLKAVVDGSGPENNNYAIVELDESGMIKLIGFRNTVSQDLIPLKVN